MRKIFSLILLVVIASMTFAGNNGKLLYSGTYKDSGVCRDLNTGFESSGVEMVQGIDIYENWLKIGCCLDGTYSHTTQSGTRVYKGSDSFGNRCTIYVTKDFDIYYDMTYTSQWGSSTCRVNLSRL